MSRCFPYPPPGFEKSAALIGTTKLQKEKEKAKKERKKEKKEKSRGDSGKKEEKRHDGRKREYEELGQLDGKRGGYFKTREDESAQLERSSLTEEQGPAVAQNICDSSDSTHDSSSSSSGKRKKLESAKISHGAHAAGVGLRIRLPLLRHKDVEPQTRSIEQPCFTARIETLPTQRQTGAPEHPQLPSSPEQPCFSGRTVPPPSKALAVPSRAKHASADIGRIRSCGCSCDSHLRRQYKNLIRDWNPPPVQVEDPESDDQDWLFGKPIAARRQQHPAEAGEQVAGKDVDLEGALCSWPPRACYLPKVGVYALPYVVPF